MSGARAYRVDVDLVEARRLYVDEELSIPAVARRLGLTSSTLRSRLLDAGVSLRTRAEGLRLVPNLGAHLIGVKREPFTSKHRTNIAAARVAAPARGIRTTSNGYVEHTRGRHKGRGAHVVIMEARLGRHLLPDEVVHHIDGDRLNNAVNNLALMTRSAHARLHRREQRLFGANQ